mmetsp:Transcript_8357/g.18238  ORF Transcript_8357/g.18238 Transcript_8357/m.18238 type:complete len:458 (+) Transcript_8357:488-1861(+)
MELKLEESVDFTRLCIDVNVIKSRPGRQTRNGLYIAAYGIEEPGSHTPPHLPHGHPEPRGHALGRGIARKGILRLGDTDGQLSESRSLVRLDLPLGQFSVIHPVRSINFPANGPDLVLDGPLHLVQKFKILILVRGARRRHRPGEVGGADPPLRPVVRHDGVKRPRLEGGRAHHLHLSGSVRLELVDGHHGVDPEFFGVLDVFYEVGAAGGDQFEVFLEVGRGEGFASAHGGSAAVHFERADGGHDNGAFGEEARGAALDVEEFFHADVGAEAGFGDDEAVGAGELERHLVGDDGRISCGDVGERSRVDHDGGRLCRLHESRHDGILHEHGHGTSGTEIISSDGRSLLGIPHDHRTKFLSHIAETGGERQHRHDLRSHGDVESGRPIMLLPRPLHPDGLRNRLVLPPPDFDLPQMPIAGVHDPLPRDRVRIDVQPHELGNLLLRQLLRVGLLYPQLP